MNDAAAIGQRFAVLARQIWGDNLRRMSADLEMSYAVVWRVVHGRRLPSCGFLTALSKRVPDLNLRWLLGGNGQPFLTDEDFRLPVSDSALLIAPAQHCVRTTPVARALFAATRYAYALRAGDPAVDDPDEHLLPGDEIIFETDSEFWSDRQRLRDRLCVVRVYSEGGVNGLLGRARCKYDKPGKPVAWFVDLFGHGQVPLVFGATDSMGAKLNAADDRDPATGRNYRVIELGDDQSQGPQASSGETSASEESQEVPGAPGETDTAHNELGAELYAVEVLLVRAPGKARTTQR